MSLTIEPEPPDQEREAIVAAIARGEGDDLGSWSQAALVEGVEEADLDRNREAGGAVLGARCAAGVETIQLAPPTSPSARSA